MSAAWLKASILPHIWAAFAGFLDENGTHKGVLLTTDKFTAPARDHVRSIKKRIILIDGPELARPMVKFGVGVTVLRQLRIVRLACDFFDEADA